VRDFVAAWDKVGVAVVDRVRRGRIGVIVGELSAIRQPWEAAGRPQPQRHVHRTPVTFVDGTTVTGVSFAISFTIGRAPPPTSPSS
jgi:hypothetical protein